MGAIPVYEAKFAERIEDVDIGQRVGQRPVRRFGTKRGPRRGDFGDLGTAMRMSRRDDGQQRREGNRSRR